MRFLIPGEPVAKGRPRLTTRGGFARAYTPKKTAEWESDAADLMREAWDKAPLALPVRVVVDAVAARPKRLVPRAMGGAMPKRETVSAGRLWRPAKPDCDNVAKAALDALVLAGVVTDDAIVVDLVARSLYAALGEGPVVEIGLFVLAPVESAVYPAVYPAWLAGP